MFRGALVETYGKGLLAFAGERLEVKPVGPEELERGDTYVVQLLHTREGGQHVIRYRMKRGGDGQWRMRNVILDEINLGKVYRNQFAAAAVKYKGDIDQVIDNWSVSENDE